MGAVFTVTIYVTYPSLLRTESNPNFLQMSSETEIKSSEEKKTQNEIESFLQTNLNGIILRHSIGPDR